MNKHIPEKLFKKKERKKERKKEKLHIPERLKNVWVPTSRKKNQS